MNNFSYLTTNTGYLSANHRRLTTNALLRGRIYKLLLNIFTKLPIFISVK